MNRTPLIAALTSRSMERVVAGMSWLGTPILREMTRAQGIDDPAQALDAVVSACDCDFVFVDAEQDWATRAVPLLAAAGVASVWAVPGILSRMTREWGWMQTLKASASPSPAFLDAVVQASYLTMASAVHGLEAGADALVVADDLAGVSGWILSPDVCLDVLMPHYASFAELAHEDRRPAILHSDGDVRLLYPSLSHAGYSAVHVGGSGPRSIAPMLAAASRVGLRLLGGVRSASLSAGTAEATAQSLMGYAKHDGLIVCDDGALTDAESVKAMATIICRMRGLESA